MEVTPGKSFILQKSAFLASEAGVQLSMHVNQKLGAGFFGGEGFIMQKLTGNGIAFAEVDGDWWNTPSPPASRWWSIPAM